MNNSDKIKIVQSKIDRAVYHISQIQESLNDESSYDIPEKLSREQQMSEWLSVKSALELELAALDE